MTATLKIVSQSSKIKISILGWLYLTSNFQIPTLYHVMHLWLMHASRFHDSPITIYPIEKPAVRHRAVKRLIFLILGP